MSTNLTQRLTDILTANPKMAHLIADKIGTKYRLPELVLYDDLKDYSTFAQYLLDQLPDSYFSSALARVADVLSEHGQCFVQLESACDDKWKAAIVRWQDDFSLYFLEEPLPFSQALRALWLVLLARAWKEG